MSVSAARIPSILPDDCQLANVTACAAAWGVSERMARDIIAEEQIPIVELGPRTRAIRVSDVRELLMRREGARHT